MKLLSLCVTVTMLCSMAYAGFMDRFKGNSIQDAPLPSPPTEPSIYHNDAFGQATPSPVPARTPSLNEPAIQEAIPTQPARVEEEPYHGIEYRWKMIRIRPGQLKLEGVMLSGVLIYVAIALLGKSSNKSRAISFWRSHIDILNAHFASILKNPSTASLTRLDGNTYLGHASGRRGTTGLTCTIKTFPRHDLIQTVYEIGYKLYDLTYISRSADSVEMVFTLPDTTKDFFWAIVNKNQLMQLKEARWDLSLFSSSIAEKKEIGNDFVTYAETGQLNDYFLKNAGKTGILELFGQQEEDKKAKEALKYLNYIIISDLVDKRPEESELVKAGSIPKNRSLVLSFRLPEAGKEASTRPLLELALNLLDVVDSSSVPSEVLKKASKRRAEVYDLLLQESRKEAKTKKLEEAQKLKKRIEDERKDKMTLQERKKVEAKEREKAMRKEAMKQQKAGKLQSAQQ